MKKILIISITLVLIISDSIISFATVIQESEPNENVTNATLLNIGDTYYGEIGSYSLYTNRGRVSDVDYIKFDLVEGEYYEIQMTNYFTFFRDTTLIMKIINPIGKESSIYTDFVYNAEKNIDSIVFTALYTGTYYLKIYNYTDFNTKLPHNYSIKISYYNYDLKPSDSTQPIEKEPTETLQTKTDISNWTVSGVKNMTYTGRVLKQSDILVSKDGEYADFIAKYKNNVNVGTATVTILGTGNYKGIITKYFKITKANNPVKVTAIKTIVVKAKKKAQTFKTITIKGAQGKVSCTITKAAKIKKFLKINSKGVITIKKLKKFKKGTYKIKVKITAAGNKNYKSKTVTKTVKVKVK